MEITSFKQVSRSKILKYIPITILCNFNTLRYYKILLYCQNIDHKFSQHHEILIFSIYFEFGNLDSMQRLYQSFISESIVESKKMIGCKSNRGLPFLPVSNSLPSKLPTQGRVLQVEEYYDDRRAPSCHSCLVIE